MKVRESTERRYLEALVGNGSTFSATATDLANRLHPQRNSRSPVGYVGRVMQELRHRGYVTRDYVSDVGVRFTFTVPGLIHLLALREAGGAVE